MSHGVSDTGSAANDERLEDAPRFEAILDDHDCGLLSGWAWDRQQPGRALAIEVRDASGVLAVGRADRWRRDLVTAGKGDGRHGFEIRVDLGALEGPVDLQLFEVGGTQALLAAPYRVTPVRPFALRLAGIEWGALVGEVITTGAVTGEPGVAENSDATAQALARLSASHAVLIDVEGSARARAGLTPGDDGHWRFALTLPSALDAAGLQTLDVAIEGFPGMEARFVGAVPRRAQADDTLVGDIDDESYVAQRRYAALSRRLGRISDRRQGVARALETLDRAHQALLEGRQQRHRFPTLALPTVRKPAISVLLPARGDLPSLYHTLASLVLTAGSTPFEVLLIDLGQRDTAHDGIADGANSLAQRVAAVCDNLRVVASGSGSLAARSAQVAKEALASHVVWLEPGVELLEGALESLYATFSDFDHIGVVGGSALTPEGRLRHAGTMMGRGARWHYCGAGETPSATDWRYVRRVDAVPPGVVMVERETWRALGGLEDADECFETLLVDFCLRAGEAGWRCLHQPGAQIVALDETAVEKRQSQSSPWFVGRWVENLSQRGSVGHEIAPAYRVLMIDAEIPRPDRSAGAYAAWQEMRLLQANGFQVSFVADNLENAGRYTRALERAGVRCFHAPAFRSVESLLRRHGREFDLIYITRFNVAEKHLEAIREFSDARIAFNNADLHFLRELRLKLSARDPDLSFPLAIRDRELAVMREVDAVLCYSDAEQAVITSHNLRQDNLHRCPWVVEGRGPRRDWVSRSGIAFLGGYRHRPNVEAVEWFVTTVMPALREALPGVRLHLYGSDTPASFRALAAEDVVMEGYVEDVSALFDAHRLFVAPLLSGAGLKGKVLETMSFGLPAVLSPVAAEGTGLVDGVSARIAHSPAEWVEAIAELYTDADRWQALSLASLSVARTHFSFDRGRERMRQILQSLGLERPTVPRALCTRRPR